MGMNKEINIPIGWKEVKLGEICHINSNSLTDKTDENFSFYYIDLSMVNDGAIEYPSNQILFKNSPSRARRIFKKGNILMSTVRPNLLGHAIIKSEVKNCICSTGFAVVEEKNGLSCNEYIYPNLFSYNIKKQIDSILVGSNYPAINSNDVKNLKILLPPLPEQEAIADILEKWDEAIEKTAKLIEAKTKKFEWLNTRLINKSNYKKIDISRIISEISMRNKEGHIERVLSVTNHSGFVLPEEQFERRVASLNTSNYKIIKKGQYAYNPSRINVGSIARLDKWNDGILSPMYTVFEIDQARINSDYFLHWLSSSEAKQRIKNSAQGSVRETVSFNDFGSILIPFPELQYQERIAKTLNTAKKEIAILEEILAKYKSQKKGLMQNLLTGKIRIK